jgi:hypothetical protein
LCISSFSNCTVAAEDPLTAAGDWIIGYLAGTHFHPAAIEPAAG